MQGFIAKMSMAGQGNMRFTFPIIATVPLGLKTGLYKVVRDKDKLIMKEANPEEMREYLSAPRTYNKKPVKVAGETKSKKKK